MEGVCVFVKFYRLPFLETWILYRGHDFGVSSVVRDAYRKYNDAEFGSNYEKDISDVQRHVKLICIAGEKASVSKRYKERNIVHEKFYISPSFTLRSLMGFFYEKRNYI
jgi:hypothetical protein